MPGPIRRRFGYGQRALRIGPDRIYMPDPISCIQFGSVVPKKARIILRKTGRPDPIWTAWPGFGQMHLAQKQVGVQE